MNAIVPSALQTSALQFLARYEGLAARMPGSASLRAAAAATVRANGLPGPREEAWRYTLLRPLTDIAFSEPVMPVSEIRLKGAHNVENVLAAVAISRLAGVASEAIRSAVREFRGVEHRLEPVRTWNGVEFYNDSKATNVDAAMKAVASFAGGVHLILGGKDKDSDYGEMRGMLRERVKAVYTIGTAAEKIARQLGGVVKIESAGTLAVAVAEATKASVPGDVVLLAPACSSFDQFENYEHRGRVFRELVRAL